MAPVAEVEAPAVWDGLWRKELSVMCKTYFICNMLSLFEIYVSDIVLTELVTVYIH